MASEVDLDVRILSSLDMVAWRRLAFSGSFMSNPSCCMRSAQTRSSILPAPWFDMCAHAVVPFP